MQFPKFNAIILNNSTGIGNAGLRHVQALAGVTRVNVSVVDHPDIKIHPNNYVHAGPRATKRAIEKFGDAEFRKGHNIAFWVHESSEVRPEFKRFVPYYNEIWTPSEYCQKIFSSAFNIPVKLVPHCITQYGFSPGVNDTFTFLHSYSGGSHILRKGTIQAIEGFKQAFDKKKTVKLIVKLRSVQESIVQYLRTLADGYNIKFLLDDFGQDRLDELYGSIDCGVFPFRSEGFGLQPLELMGFGKPSIIVGGSGCDDFCTSSNSFMLPFELGATNDDYFPGEWFYHDSDDLVSAYRMAVERSEGLQSDCFATALNYSVTSTISATWKALQKYSAPASQELVQPD